MPTRRTGELHGHRWSNANTRYFVTCCTDGRLAGLHAGPTMAALRAAVKESDRLADSETYAFTVMPDHVHWLFRLGARLSLGRVVARFKAKTKAALASEGLQWQRDFFEHRLRPDESIEDYGRYVLLNPYRANVTPGGDVWHGWWCPRPEIFRFTTLLEENGAPPGEWIGETVPPGLAVGE